MELGNICISKMAYSLVDYTHVIKTKETIGGFHVT